MKYYLAHNFESRIKLRETVQQLADAGHECTSSWINTPFAIFDKLTTRQQAELDIEDIDRADAFILFVDRFDDKPGRGKWVELGYALGKYKMVFLVGTDFSCIFASLPQIISAPTIATVIQFLA